MRSLISVLVLALALTACGNDEGDPSVNSEPASPSASTEPTESESSTGVTPDASYGSVTDLRDALIELGYPCPNWKQTDKLTNASSSGSCSSDDVFSVYLDAADLKRQITTLRSIGGFDEKNFGAPMLAGPNWLLNVDDADQYREALGGIIIAN